MNPINRIGQKVICVGDERVWFVYVCPTIVDFPKRGEVYTVAGFANVGDSTLPGIHLREVPPLECACKSIVGAAWLLSAFRPVDERKTDISEFNSLLTPTKRELVYAD